MSVDYSSYELSGGDTPFDNSDPRTFPAGYNALLAALEEDLSAREPVVYYDNGWPSRPTTSNPVVWITYDSGAGYPSSAIENDVYRPRYEAS